MKTTPTILRTPFAGARTSLRAVTPAFLTRQTVTQRLVLPPIPADPYRAGYRAGERVGFTTGLVTACLLVAFVRAAVAVAVIGGEGL